MDDMDGVGDEPGSNGVDGWMPLTALPEDVQRGLRSKITVRRHRAMKRAGRFMGERLRESPEGEGTGGTAT